MAVNLEKEPNYLSIRDEANFVKKKSSIFQLVGRLFGKYLKFREIGFISKFTANLAFS